MPTDDTQASASEQRARQFAGVLLVCILLLIGSWSLPEHVQAGDAGEFATVILRGGVPHPSGYPWMRMLTPLAWPFERLGISPAKAAAIPCLVIGVVGWRMLFSVLCTIVPTLVAFLATLWTATSAPVLLHASDSEVFGPLVLFAALFLRACIASRHRTPLRVGFWLGIALTQHLTAVLLLPLAVGTAWPERHRLATWMRSITAAVIGVTFGLLPYVTLMMGRGGAWRWGDTHTPWGLVHHVLRLDYGLFDLSLHAREASTWMQWDRATRSVAGALTAGVVDQPIVSAIVLAAALLAIGIWARPNAIPRTMWTGLLGSLVASQMLFPALHDIDPSRPFGAWILERFDVLTLVLWTPVLACGIARAFAALPKAGRIVCVLGLLVLMCGQVWRAARLGIFADHAGVEHYAIDVLRTPSERSLIFGTDDHRLFPLLFVREVLRIPSQGIYVDASLLAHPWYRTYLRRQWPDLPEATLPLQLIGMLWQDPTYSDMPIYFTNDFSRPAAALPRVPEGVLWRLVPPHRAGTEAFEMDQVSSRHRAALRRYRGVPVSTHPTALWANDVAHAYVDGSTRLATALRAAGRDKEAQSLLDELAALQARAAR